MPVATRSFPGDVDEKSALLLALTASFAIQTAHAQTAQKQTVQQSKMISCNKEAGDKKGDERQAFMKQCLKKS
jgi:hypothetical protein